MRRSSSIASASRSASGGGSTSCSSTVKKPAPPQLKKVKSVVGGGQPPKPTSAVSSAGPRKPSVAAPPGISSIGSTSASKRGSMSASTVEAAPGSSRGGAASTTTSSARLSSEKRFKSSTKAILGQDISSVLSNIDGEESSSAGKDSSSTSSKFRLDDNQMSLSSKLRLVLGEAGEGTTGDDSHTTGVFRLLGGGSNSSSNSKSQDDLEILWDPKKQILKLMSLGAGEDGGDIVWSSHAAVDEQKITMPVVTSSSSLGDVAAVSSLLSVKAGNGDQTLKAQHEGSSGQTTANLSSTSSSYVLGDGVKLSLEGTSAATNSTSSGRNQQPFQKGTLINTSGKQQWKFEGLWSNGARAGKGTLLAAGGNHVFEGEFVDDNRHGPGIVRFPATDGKSTFTAQVKGTWSMGRMTGCPRLAINPSVDDPPSVAGGINKAPTTDNNNESSSSSPLVAEYSSSVDGSEVKIKLETGSFSGAWSENPRELFARSSSGGGKKVNNVTIIGKNTTTTTGGNLQGLSDAGRRMRSFTSARALQRRLLKAVGFSSASVPSSSSGGGGGESSNQNKTNSMEEAQTLVARQRELMRIKNHLQGKSDSVQTILDESKKLQASKKRLQSRLSSGKEQTEKAESKISTLKSQLSKDATTKAKVESDIGKEEANQAQLKAFLDKNNGSNANTSGGLSSSNDDAGTTSSVQHKTPEDELTYLQQQASKLTATLRDLSTDMRNLKSKKESSGKDISSLEDEITRVERHLASCEEAMASAQEKTSSQRDQYEKLVSQSKEGNCEASSLVDDLVAETERLQDEHESLKTRIMDAKSRKEDLHKTQNQLKNDIINLGLKLDDTRVTADSAAEEARGLEQQLDEARGELSASSHLSEIRKEIENLKLNLKENQKAEDKILQEIADIQNQGRTGYQSASTVKEKYEKSVANFKRRIAALKEDDDRNGSTPPSPPPLPSAAKDNSAEEEELKSLQEQINLYMAQTDESYTEKRQVQRRIDTASGNATKYREKIKKLEDKIEKENQQKEKESAFTGTTEDLKRLVKETKKENEEAAAELSDLKSAVAIKQSEYDRLQKQQEEHAKKFLHATRSQDQRVKLLQEEVDRRESVISSMRHQVKRVSVLESKLASAKDQAAGLSQARAVRRGQSSLNLKRQTSNAW